MSLGKRQENSIPSRGNSQCKDHVAGKCLCVVIMEKSSLRPPGLRIHSLWKGKLWKVLCDLCLQNQKGNLHNAPILGEEETVFSKVLVAAAATLLSNVIPEGSRYSNPNHLNLALKLFLIIWWSASIASLFSLSPPFHPPSLPPSLLPSLSPSLPLLSSFIFSGLRPSEYSKQDFYFLQLHYQPLKTAAQSPDSRSRSLIMYLLRVPSSTQRLPRIDAKLSSARAWQTQGLWEQEHEPQSV